MLNVVQFATYNKMGNEIAQNCGQKSDQQCELVNKSKIRILDGHLSWEVRAFPNTYRDPKISSFFFFKPPGKNRESGVAWQF